MRGEHDTSLICLPGVLGSSPHARGAPALSGACVAGIGIIPACAGSTAASSSDVEAKRDHPRMRGEHFLSRNVSDPTKGSSPHARGAPNVSPSVRAFAGIIPACAGSTLSPSRIKLLRRDHPRMRGEHSKSGKPMVTCWGSSPHARGAH